MVSKLTPYLPTLLLGVSSGLSANSNTQTPWMETSRAQLCVNCVCMDCQWLLQNPRTPANLMPTSTLTVLIPT